jgi:DNA-directed RNA polymerase specialized sigma24 family protein
VFSLFHLQKLSYREISQIMGIRPRSIANHLQAAIADLRSALKDRVPGLARSPDRSS